MSVSGATRLVRQGARLIVAIARSFHRNHGLLLAAALAFQTLLSIIPLTILLVVGLSHVIPPDRIVASVVGTFGAILPGQRDMMDELVRTFLENRRLLSGFGVLTLLFFSSLAFTTLEEALHIQFSHRQDDKKRHFLISAIMPYIFIMVIAAALGFTTAAVGVLEALAGREVHAFGTVVSLRGLSVELARAGVLVGEVGLLTAFYHFLPVGRTRVSHAFVGAATATVLWEITRRVLVWYYDGVSLVPLLYGSIATVVVALLTLEVAAVILLLGAQVIAELEKAEAEGDARREEAAGAGPG